MITVKLLLMFLVFSQLCLAQTQHGPTTGIATGFTKQEERYFDDLEALKKVMIKNWDHCGVKYDGKDFSKFLQVINLSPILKMNQADCEKECFPSYHKYLQIFLKNQSPFIMSQKDNDLRNALVEEYKMLEAHSLILTKSEK